jgi:hypothetical protein
LHNHGDGLFIIEGKGCQFPPPLFLFSALFVINIPIFPPIIYNQDVDYK